MMDLYVCEELAKEVTRAPSVSYSCAEAIMAKLQSQVTCANGLLLTSDYSYCYRPTTPISIYAPRLAEFALVSRNWSPTVTAYYKGRKCTFANRAVAHIEVNEL